MNHHSRRSVLIATLLSAFSLKSTSALAASTPTLKPTKIGQTIIFRGKKYTAIKSGKKIVWDKGVSIPSGTSTSAANLLVLGKSSELSVGQTKAYSAGKTYFVTRESTGLTAVDSICTHQGCTVELSGKDLVCPCHGSSFNSVTGGVINGPAQRSLRRYTASDVDGNIVITL